MLRHKNSESVCYFQLLVQLLVVGILSRILTQVVKTQSGGQGYCLVMEMNAAALSKNSVFLKALEVTADVPNRSVSEYRTHHGQMLDARRFSGTISDGQNRTVVDRRGMWHDTDFDAWQRR